MRSISMASILLGVLAAVIGGISRLMLTPLIVDSRAWAGAATILLVLACAINTLSAKSQP